MFLACITFTMAAVVGVDDPWADEVLEYVAYSPNAGFNEPLRALRAPVGAGPNAPNNNSVVSVGTAGSYLTLGFDTPITDDPLNPQGLDFIVYSNSFWAGGNPQAKWTEPALIAISHDDNGNGLPDDAWYYFPGSRNLGAEILPAGIPNPDPPLSGLVWNPNSLNGDPSDDQEEYDLGYAELTPTQQEYLDNYLRPDDPFIVGLSPRSGGGDAFDIAWAVDAEGAPAEISSFHFIRIWSFIIGTHAVTGPITPEIDAVADVAPDMDSDGDSILDEYEIRVAGTDPFRAESTVLALEIPAEEGGSPTDALLGTASDPEAFRVRLYSAGARSGVRAYNALVDLLPVADYGPAIQGYLKTQIRRQLLCSEADFALAQVQDAALEFPVRLAQISGLDPASLRPFRREGAGWTQAGISQVHLDMEAGLLRFRTRYPGSFVLAGIALDPGGGDPGEFDPEHVWVDFLWEGAEVGSFAFPFRTLQAATQAVSAGGTVHVMSGDGPETLRITRHMRLQAEAGVVHLGKVP